MQTMLIKLCRFIPDSIYLKLLFYKNVKKFLNLKNPTTFNEKLQWLKLNDRKQEYTKLVDKYEVRNYIKEEIGEKYLIPLLAVWNNASEIDFSKLPNQFVLKCNHDSRSVIICKDKRKINIQKTVKKLNMHLKQNAYWYGREWPYKNVKPLILAEEFLEEEINQPLVDYKVLCFNGKAKFVQVHCGRGTENYTQDFYDLEWNRTTIGQKGINHSKVPLNKPVFLKKMIFLSEILAKDFIHVRVDWYFVKDQLYFGELTFFDGSGFLPFSKTHDDVLLGNLINIQ
ncbi:glycosyl transferase [Lysinibacillus sp. PLM2]|nr:glycosyl transferase [Lysinibacillus sp. PLM2]